MQADTAISESTREGVFMSKVISIERDPIGIGQHEPGAKLDEGKIRAGLVVGHFKDAIKECLELIKNQPELVHLFASDHLERCFEHAMYGLQSRHSMIKATVSGLLYLESVSRMGKPFSVPEGIVFSDQKNSIPAFLMVSSALLIVSEVGTYGANKYTTNGWKDVPDGRNRYFDALWRHLLKVSSESRDKDTQMLHMAHAVWNMLAVHQIPQ